MFLDRWSPRAFSAEPIPETELLTMLEAARWAASSYNSQPWRFVYARRDTPHWELFLELLVPNNRAWAQHASALVVVISNPMMRRPGGDAEVRSLSHSFDTGAAAAYFALQAHLLGWHAHGMIGFDRERAVESLHVPKHFNVEAAFAIGRLGDPSQLPDFLQSREFPSHRRPLSELAFEGSFPTPHQS